jgi:hypothetical protein
MGTGGSGCAAGNWDRKVLLPFTPSWLGWGERTSRFLDSAGSSAFADDPAALEMTMGRGGSCCARNDNGKGRIRLRCGKLGSSKGVTAVHAKLVWLGRADEQVSRLRRIIRIRGRSGCARNDNGKGGYGCAAGNWDRRNRVGRDRRRSHASVPQLEPGAQDCWAIKKAAG